jgi:hypothetical protein
MLLDSEEMEKRVARHRRFWAEAFEGEGAYIAVRGPERSGESATAAAPPVSPREKWLDIDDRLERAIASMEATCYAGDAIPVFFADMGPSFLPALLGAPCRFADNTVWFDLDPPLREWRDRPRLAIDRDGEFHAALTALCREASERAQGRYVVGIPDHGVNLDVLAGLRGRERLLLDLIEEPEAVKAVLVELDEIWTAAFEESYALLGGGSTPISSWVPLVLEGRWYPLLSELTAMVSPAMFEEFALPALQREADILDRVFFNLDGPSQVGHLPALLTLRGLHSIEWDPVPGFDPGLGAMRKNFSGKESIEVCRRILAAGIKLMLNGLAPDQAEALMEVLPRDGVFLVVDCASADEAEEFAAYAKRWVRE